jgi:hypothetical protein
MKPIELQKRGLNDGPPNSIIQYGNQLAVQQKPTMEDELAFWRVIEHLGYADDCGPGYVKQINGRLFVITAYGVRRAMQAGPGTGVYLGNIQQSENKA